MIRSARVVAKSSPYFLPDSSSPSSISGLNRSVSYTDGTSWRMLAIRSSPRPVSMFFVGSSGSDPSAWSSYCMNTRFQNSR